MDTVLKGWAEDQSKISPQLTPYYSMRDELSIYDGLVFKGERLVVPQGLRAEIIKERHTCVACWCRRLFEESERECVLAWYEL